MIPTTVVALLVFGVAVLPGAMYRWAYEREASAFGVTLADRALRLVGVSLLLDALYAWPGYLACRAWFAGRSFGSGQFALAWCGAVVGVALPYALGTVVGGLYTTRGSREGWRFVRRFLTEPVERRLLYLLVGVSPARRAWEYVFEQRPRSYVRVRLVDGSWVGGRFGERSCAGTAPEDTDLFIEEAWPVGADGRFGATRSGHSLYLPASAFSYIEIADHPPEEST